MKDEPVELVNEFENHPQYSGSALRHEDLTIFEAWSLDELLEPIYCILSWLHRLRRANIMNKIKEPRTSTSRTVQTGNCSRLMCDITTERQSYGSQKGVPTGCRL